MVIAHAFGMSGLGLSPIRGHYVVILGKTLYSCTVSLSTHVYKFNTGGNCSMD